MNHFYRVTLSFVVVLLLSGFSLFDSQEERNNKALAKSFDPALTAAFWPSPFTFRVDGKNKMVVTDSSIKIEQVSFLFAKSQDEWISKHLALDTGNDEISKKYIQMGTARGNTVKQYKSPVNERIGMMFVQEDNMAGYYLWTRYDFDPAFIEFTPNGRVVSAMVRAARMGKNQVYLDSVVTTRIYYGLNRISIENELNNRFLEDHLLDVQKPVSQ